VVTVKENWRTQWAILFSYGLVLLLSNIIWLTFSALEEVLTSPSGIYANVDKFSFAVLTFANPITSIFVATPAGFLADRKGFKFTVTIGAISGTIFAFLRVFVWNSFVAQLILQFAVSLSGLLVLASISKLSSDFFSENERGRANGISTLFMLSGMALGLFLSPVLFAAVGLPFLLLSYGLSMAVSTVIFLAVSNRFPIPDSKNHSERETGSLPDRLSRKRMSDNRVFGSVLRTKELWILSFAMFVGYGITQVLLAYLPSMLASRHVGDAFQVGIVSSFLMIGGTIGSIIVPFVSDRVHRRKPFLMLSVLAGATLSSFLAAFGGFEISVIVAAVLGFLLVPILPLTVTLLPDFQSIGAKRVGTATGIIFLFGSTGAVILGFLVDKLKVSLDVIDPVTHQELFSYLNSAILTSIVSLIAFVSLSLMREVREK